MRILGTLALTHSSRPVDPGRCSVQFLSRRFESPDRLRDLPPLDSLGRAPRLSEGAVSFYRLERDDTGRLRIRQLGHMRQRWQIQHVAFLSEREILAGFEHHVERWHLDTEIDRSTRLRPKAKERFEHPWLVGLHTVEPMASGTVALSCSSPDAVLLATAATGDVTRVLRMPEDLYGRGYELGPESDLRRHYIPTDRQTTHLNAAFGSPDGRRLAVSALIPGAVGVFDLADGSYREWVRGFVGCHGARFDRDGRLYFTDSATGTLVFLDTDGRIVRRFAVPSRWLHDVQQVDGSVYAFALSEPNELRIYDIDENVLLYRRRFVRCLPPLIPRGGQWLGKSAQALSFRRSGVD